MSNAHNIINLNQLSPDAFQRLLELDIGFIGSEDYMGIAYFWHHEYRHYLRDCTVASRRKVHQRMLKQGLVLYERSPAHECIIKRHAKGYKQ